MHAGQHSTRMLRQLPRRRIRFEQQVAFRHVRRIRRPSEMLACSRPGVCGGGNAWKRDSWVTRSWKIGAGAGPGGRSQT